MNNNVDIMFGNYNNRRGYNEMENYSYNGNKQYANTNQKNNNNSSYDYKYDLNQFWFNKYL